MKPKFILCLALVLSGSFTTQRAYGYVAEIRINHANLKTDYSFLKIKTVRLNFTNDPVVFFTVIVMPKGKRQQSEHFKGNLEINDASMTNSQKVICYTSVEARKLTGGTIFDEIPKSMRAKCIVFEFGVAVKFLETSEFRVEETAGEFDPLADYCFNLKEFADDK
jgi:hypothetical protein